MADLRRLRRSEVVVDLARPAPELDRLADLPGRRRPAPDVGPAAHAVAHRTARTGPARAGRRRRRCGSTSGSPRSRRSSSTTTGRCRRDRRDRAAARPSGRPRRRPAADPAGRRRRGAAGAPRHARGRALISGVLAAFVAAEYRGTFSGAVSAALAGGAGGEPGDPHAVRPARRARRPGRFHGLAHRHRARRPRRRVGARWPPPGVTRGEEEAGRWDLLLAGRLRLPALVRAHAGRPPASRRRSPGAAVGARPAARRRRARRVRCCSGR